MPQPQQKGWFRALGTNTLITSHSARSVLTTPSLRVSEGLSYPVSKGSFSSSSWETACPDPAAIPDVSSYKARCFRPLITGKELCKLLGESIDRSTRALIAFLAAGLLKTADGNAETRRMESLDVVGEEHRDL